MADDDIQSLIVRWYYQADLKAGGRAFEQLKREWLLPVARFIHRDVMSPDTEDALSSVLLELLSHSPDKPPRALAPVEHPSPKAWRARVLRNALINTWRRQRVRRVIDETLTEDQLTRGTVDPAGLTGGLGAPPALAGPGSAYETEQRVLLQQMRRAVVRALPELPVRRRCAIGMLLGVDLSAWVDELAADLGEDADALYRRLEAAGATAIAEFSRLPADAAVRSGGGFGEDLSDPQLRILYPTEDLSRARESMRKTIERGVKDVKAHLAKGVA